MSIKQSLAAAAIATTAGLAPAANAADFPTIVLVHGAWANGSSWSTVVPLLQEKGLDVVAVHNPMTSFDADVAATRRVIGDQPGDVILVGHSYGGAVITEAGSDPKVKALVYVAAFAPSAGESINAIIQPFGQPEWIGEIHADSAGMLTWSEQGMAKYIAPDLPEAVPAVLTATQAPFFAGNFDGKITAAAFGDKPSWYVVADDDQIIPAPLQTAFAEKMGATTTHVASNHLVMLTQPQAVADAILAAVAASE